MRVELALVERELALDHEDEGIRGQLRGDAVVAMDNFGADLTFFPAVE
jgi:hypothetical protein